MKLLFLAAATASIAGSAGAVQVYSNDFQGGSTAGFSSGSIQTSPNGSAEFLGPFAQGGSTTLSLSSLAAHSMVTVSFDVDVILSMDGDGQFGGGRDQFLVTTTAPSASTLLDNDYANYPGNTQDNGGQGTPTIAFHYAPQTGASSVNTFGYAFGGNPSIDDSVYHYTFTFADTASNLGFTFHGNTSEGVSNEFYGIDNVVVSINAPGGVPEPTTWALMLIGVGAAGATLRGSRRQRLAV
ncbi:MAG: PEPxxWA-CTERM sorting domain-containing protein [Caulobacteraceae bacterium]